MKTLLSLVLTTAFMILGLSVSATSAFARDGANEGTLPNPADLSYAPPVQEQKTQAQAADVDPTACTRCMPDGVLDPKNAVMPTAGAENVHENSIQQRPSRNSNTNK